MDRFFRTHEVVFFFSSSCPHCHQQAPILKRWATLANVKVVSYSFDERTLPGFEDALPAPTKLITTAFQNQPIRYPALFILNRRTYMLYPVAVGEISEQQLDARMQHLIPKVIQFEARQR